MSLALMMERLRRREKDTDERISDLRLSWKLEQAVREMRGDLNELVQIVAAIDGRVEKLEAVVEPPVPVDEIPQFVLDGMDKILRQLKTI